MERIKVDRLAGIRFRSTGCPWLRGWDSNQTRFQNLFISWKLMMAPVLAISRSLCDQDLSNYDDIRKLTTGSDRLYHRRSHCIPGKGGKNGKSRQRLLRFTTSHRNPFHCRKKRHTDEFLRTIAHLRPRTNKYGAAFRIRSELAYAVHPLFQGNAAFGTYIRLF